jgi:hypothetical protein
MQRSASCLSFPASPREILNRTSEGFGTRDYRDSRCHARSVIANDQLPPRALNLRNIGHRAKRICCWIGNHEVRQTLERRPMATHSALTKGAWIEGDRLESLRQTLALAAPHESGSGTSPTYGYLVCGTVERRFRPFPICQAYDAAALKADVHTLGARRRVRCVSVGGELPKRAVQKSRFLHSPSAAFTP